MSTPITAAQVKELRERTGAGMSDCKKALEATGGDMNKAAEKLRIDGGSKADKKAGRTAAEGVIALAVGADAVALVEVNSETDFVAKGEDFRALAKDAAHAALKHKPADAAALGQLAHNASETLDARRRAMVAKIGENIGIRRHALLAKAAGELVTYTHPGDKIIVALALEHGDAQLGKDLAMHIAAMNPRYLDTASVPADVLAAERKVVEAQIAKEQAEEAEAGKKPKPAEIIAKMVDGKLRKFAEENTLLGQEFVRNADYGMKAGDTIDKLLKAKNAKVAGFVRFAVGDGIEKKETDFAAEVAAMAKG